ncbi:MAG: class I SAM-dependent methyltransferase [Alphaproteobacteria bacterium]|nr:class I SAM-dependent methyltransferase [Alphaproteobacteria bacterium]
MPEQEFKDHFSGMAATYAQFRPRYPDSLFEALAARAPARGLAWDCGCGNGQASAGLARYFEAVIATDPSAAQIDRADPIDKVAFHVAAAEAAPQVPDGAVDLIVAAQAAHWFDLPRFYDEVRRVSRPGALLALVSYRPTRIDDPGADAALQHFYANVVGPYWPPERRHVDEGYASLDFPFPEENGPDMVMDVSWTLDRLVDYAGTWSAVKEYRRLEETDPLPQLRDGLAAVWGDPEAAKRIYWPLAFRLGRVGQSGV